jgi:hypothetical protein
MDLFWHDMEKVRLDPLERAPFDGRRFALLFQPQGSEPILTPWQDARA